MRTARRVGRTVVLRLRFDDFSRATRPHDAPGDRRVAHDPRAARELLASAGPLSPATGSPSSVSRSATSTTSAPSQLTLRSSPGLDRTRRGARRGPRPLSGTAAIMRAVLLAGTRASRCPCSRTEASRPDRRRATGTRGRPHATRRCAARAARQAGGQAPGRAPRAPRRRLGLPVKLHSGRLKAPTTGSDKAGMKRAARPRVPCCALARRRRARGSRVLGASPRSESSSTST